jgi:hypothetical protein
MSLASDVLESLKNVSKLSNIKEEDGMDSEVPTTDDTEQPSQVNDDNTVLTNLETALSNALIDLGVSSIEVVQEDDGSVYADMVFEDLTKLSVQFYTKDGLAKIAVITPETLESPVEMDLPSEFVAEDGTLNLTDLTSLPIAEIKKAVSEYVTVTNQTEVCRRSVTTNESLTQKRIIKI